MGVLAVSIHPPSPQLNLIEYLAQPYRSLGIGSQCLELIKNAASAYKKTKIRRIYLHVQISNEGAKQFYQRHGFTELGVAENYYKKITPRDAWILEAFVEGQTSEVQK